MVKYVQYIILSFLFIFLIAGVSAEVNTYAPVKQGECITLKQNCPSCSYVNFSVTYPNSTIAISEVEGVNSGGGLFIYDSFCYTGALGRHDVTGHGDLEGVDRGFDVLWFDVTPTGITQTISQGLGSTIFLVLMLSLTFLFGWIGFKLSESKNLWIMGIFMLFLSFIFVVYDVWLGYEYHRNFTGLTDNGMPETIFYIFMTLLVVGVLVSLALLFTRWKELAAYIKSELKKKKEDEEFDRDFE